MLGVVELVGSVNNEVSPPRTTASGLEYPLMPKALNKSSFAFQHDPLSLFLVNGTFRGVSSAEVDGVSPEKDETSFSGALLTNPCTKRMDSLV